LFPVLVACAIAGVLALTVSGGGRSYELHLQLNDADGLRNGAKAVIGGVQVGTVQLRLGRHDQVLATVALDPRDAPVGRDASAIIASVNLLGQKDVELIPGDRQDPAPSGWTIPASRVTPSTDLDQVLDVLTPDTRDQLTVLINELGAAVTGRRADFSALLQELPNSLATGTTLLQRLAGDHRRLVDLVAKSDRFVTALAQQRTALAQLVGTASRTAVAVSARDAQLRQTLAELPATLADARGFLEDLRQTTVPLGPAAVDIERTAPDLATVLGQLGPFTTAATPTLQQATAVAPELTRLATGAAPVLGQAVAPLRTLATDSSELVPVSDTLAHSADNLVGILTNWSHAIELRDGLSHVFRAEVTVTPQTLQGMIDRLLSTQTAHRPAPARQIAPRPMGHSATPPPAASNAPTAAPPAPAAGGSARGVLSGLGSTLSGLVHKIAGSGGQQSSSPPPGQSHSGLQSLLGYLLRP
jgi:phospholipid/cholesterol/gamma-HCH transport system substrate-binding protein